MDGEYLSADKTRLPMNPLNDRFDRIYDDRMCLEIHLEKLSFFLYFF